MMEIDVNQELKIKFEAGSIKGEDGITPHIGDNGNWYVGGTDTGVQATGERGEPGQPGYTPVKGVDYFDGQPGQPGKDGISPVVKVTDIENGHRVTITTGSDVQSFDVMNGKDGEGGSGGGGTSMTDLETIAMLADNDLLPAITDGSGRILTDAKNTIMLRY